MIKKPNVETLQQGLLDYLAVKSGLLYLSDLKFPQFSPCVLSALAVTAHSKFSVREWNQAIVYILNEEVGFEEAEAAKDYLMEQMKKMNCLSNPH